MYLNIFYTLVLLGFINITISYADEEAIIVTLPYGKIKGHILQSANNKEYYAFQEIPYASPPVGELRFKEPVYPKNWDNVLDTTKNTKICHQQKLLFPVYYAVETEDCLYLNVYTPQNPNEFPKESLSVYVWMYGGGFINGDATFTQYGPKYLIDTGIIVVTLNYRVGPLGFLNTGDGIIPGNLGLKDQHFAFKWIKENIKLFGGDPEKITIGGESSGAFSVTYHLLSKKSKGLFRAGIQQSGTALSPVHSLSGQVHRKLAFRLGTILDPSFTSEDSKDLLKLLKSKSGAEITNANFTMPPDMDYGDLPWGPVIEDDTHDNAFITRPMEEDLKNGIFTQVPVLLGFNSEEYMLLAVFDITHLFETAALYDENVSTTIHHTFKMTEKDKEIAGRELKRLYTNTTFQQDFGSLVRFMSDLRFTTPIIRQACLQSQYTDVYLYEISYKGTFPGMNLTIDGVDPNSVWHGEELPYIWDMAYYAKSILPKEDILNRNRLLKMLSNFIKHLNPTPESDELLGGVKWPKVSSGDIKYLNINKTLEVKTNPKLYKQWAHIIDSYAIQPLTTY